jgi:hypothetical protein
MTKTATKPLGPRMRQAFDYIAIHPGCSKAKAGGWYSIERLIRRGLVREELDENSGTYSLYLTADGRARL